MELSHSVTEGIAIAGDSAHIPDKLFPNFVDVAFRGILTENERNVIADNPAFSGVDKAVLKEGYSAIVSLILEAVKHDTNAESLSGILEDCKFTSERIKVFVKTYQVMNDFIGHPPPHIVDVDWRLDYYIKNNHLEKVNEAVYLISLKTEVPGNPELQEVQFSCSLEQLQLDYFSLNIFVFAEYKYENGPFNVTKSMRQDFNNYGYIMVRNLLSNEELKSVKHVLEDNKGITQHSYDLPDGLGRSCEMALWCHPGNDVTGMVARCEKIVNTCEALLEGEVYHYHTKLMMKNAKTGGSFLWHQDYGYWYKNGCLYPDMMTVFIAIDKCSKENGCLQILRGSHLCGRIDHVMVAGQTGADVERVEQIEKVCPRESVEMEPGDALFFHSNLIHTSAGNDSAHRRWAFLIAYNKASNDPVIKHHCPQYTPLNKVPNSEILDCKNFTDMTGKDFLNPQNDKTVRAEDSK
ncbi:hypothetical protein FSP39_012835 [Pinctada imbricata]|uniref:COMM domain-containing protein 3 n=1 Tax=Pinctada imbricata TaxID=66713 RepID=A0AA88XMA0_PINIB|nr:hypothetical protein FSP39_012835 [Pinctada imbricata]